MGLEIRWATSYPPVVRRRYAILDDNQRLLEERVESLRRVLPRLGANQVCAAMVIGSVAQGQARDESDVDLVLVLRHGTPRRTDYVWWDTQVKPRLGCDRGQRFPVQPVIIGREALDTAEPHLRGALRSGIVIWDPEGVFDDQSEARP